jgi:prepilin-type N-terminal cleavage/methylation domain-containing protein
MEFGERLTQPPLQLQRNDCEKSVIEHTVGAMHPRIVGHPLRRMPVSRRLAFHSNCVQERRPHRAFTLIELLVVIAIIAILIGLLFPAFSAVQNQAKKTQAKNDLTQIVNAVNAFYTEYGKYPLATDDSIITNNAPLMNVLRAIDTANNPRQIVFISPPNVKNTASPRSGIGSDGQYYDPFGTAYSLRIDGNYDNQLANPYTHDTGAGPLTLNIGVIAWSLGKDQTLGTDFNASDDVISWQ